MTRLTERSRSRSIVIRATIGVIALLALMSACGGGGDDFGSGGIAHGAGINLFPPEGWVSLTNLDSLVVASVEEDLRAAIPQGPRLTVGPGATELPDPEKVESRFASADAEEAARLELLEEPAVIAAGVGPGVFVTLAEEVGGVSMVRRYVIANADSVNVFQFLLEAPANRWEESIETLEAIMRTALLQESASAPEPSTSPATTGSTPEPGSQSPTTSAPEETGFATAEEAVYAGQFPGLVPFNEAAEIIACDLSIELRQRMYPCHHFWGPAGNGDLIYQLQEQTGNSYWLLVRQLPDGTYKVEDFEFDTRGIEFTGEPPF